MGKRKMPDHKLMQSIEFANWHDPVSELRIDEYGDEEEVRIYASESLLPFVKCLLRDLGVMK